MHLTLGYFLSKYYTNTTLYTCNQHCYKVRSSYRHHHCVLEWYDANNFTRINNNLFHPLIYLYPFQPTVYYSPQGGWTFQLHKTSHFQLNSTIYKPLSIHPCKVDPFVHPNELWNNVYKYCHPTL